MLGPTLDALHCFVTFNLHRKTFRRVLVSSPFSDEKTKAWPLRNQAKYIDLKSHGPVCGSYTLGHGYMLGLKGNDSNKKKINHA